MRKFSLLQSGGKIFFSITVLSFLTVGLFAQVDCPALNANIGDGCDDGDRYTTYDKVQSNCTCAGVLRNDEIAHWDFNACKAGQSFGEFMPVTSTPFGFEQVVGSVFFNTKMHSCNPGPAISKPNNNIAVCRDIRPYCFWVDESEDAYKFSIRVTPEAGEAIQLTGIEFFEKAPQVYEWTSGDTGPNNPPKMYGWRILQDGVEVGRQIDVPTSGDWSKEEFRFDSLNITTSICSETTFQFELLGYCRDGDDHDFSIWDIDEFRIFGRAIPVQQLAIDQAALTTFVECDGSGNLGEFNEWLNNHGFATVVDPYGNASWTNNYDGELDYYCGATGDREVTFTATNPCGQSVSTTATFTVADNGDPFFIFVPSDNTLECDQPEPTDVPLAGDNCSGQAGVYERKYYRLDGDCPYNYQIVKEWRATDECGLYADASQVITFEDNTAPQFDFVPASVTINCDDPIPTTEPAYSDNCAALSEISIVLDEDIVNNGCPEAFTITKTWSITDACGNSTFATQVITVVDTEEPTFNNVPADFTQDCNLPVPAPPTVTATDNCDPAPVVTFQEVSFPIACGSQVVRVWNVSDACGNANTAQQTITLEDTTPPVFDTPPADGTFECNINTNSNEFIGWLNTAGGAVVSDDCSTFSISNNFVGVLTGTCGTTSFVDVTFTATDNCGNASTASARFATVDNLPPDLMVAAQDQTVPCDGSGNVNNLNAWLGANGNAIATDQCMFSAPAWSNNYNPANFVPNCGETGSVEVTFTATDQCGNSIETTATFTIEDTQPPFIIKLPDNLVVDCDDPTINTQIDDWLMRNGDAVATDICTGTLTWTNSYTGLFSTTCGNTTVTFTGTDDCGQTVTVNSTIVVQDNSAPTFSNLPVDVTIDCNDPIPTDVPTVTDNCTMAFLAEQQVFLPTSCVDNYTLQRQFTASDQCGNSTTAVHNVTVEDNSPPVFDVLPINGMSQCEPFPVGAINANNDFLAWLNANNASVAATDDCSAVVFITNDFSSFSVNCNNDPASNSTYTWTATDECGNTTTASATFIVTPVPTPLTYNPSYEYADGHDISSIGQDGAINQFAVSLKERIVNLYWVNNTGHLNDHFEIERSFDGTNFQALKWVGNGGTDETVLAYEAIDDAPISGTNHYRLKTYYKDGTHLYSPIRQVKISDIEDFGLFPNPAQEEVMISLKGYEGRQTTVQLVDQLGHVLLEEQVDGNSPNHRIGLQDYRNGFYSIWVFAERRRPIGKRLIINKMY